MLFLFFLIFACKRNENDVRSKVFRYNESKGVVSLDPAFARNQATIWPVAQIYNGLLQCDDSLNILPCIAKSYSISNDGKEYTFILRNDIYFHDHPLFLNKKGRKLIAQDVVFSFNRLINPDLASPGSWVLNVLDKEKANFGVLAINDTILKIYLSVPFAPFAGLLTIPYCFIVPFEIVKYYGRDFRSHPVGTGPFYLKMWAEGEKMILRKNEHYFEKDSVGNYLPRVDAVSISFIADKQSEFMEFIKGRIDFISGVNASFKDELISVDGSLQKKYQQKLKMLKVPYLNTEYLGFMIDKAKMPDNQLLDKRVRQAINLAIDRQKLTSYLRNNIGTPANSGFVPKGMASFSEKKVMGFNYNPDSSRKLLADAGFPFGKGLQTIKITTVSDYLDICEFVQHELEMVNIPVEVETVTGLAYREMLANCQMQMFRASWIADYADAENYLSLFYSNNFAPSGPNYTHFMSSKYDALYENSQKETDETARFDLYYKMDQMIVDEALIVPLFYDEAIRFTQFNIKNLGINPLNMLNLKYVDK